MKEIKLAADEFDKLYRAPWGTTEDRFFLDVNRMEITKGQNILLTDSGGSGRCIGVTVEAIYRYTTYHKIVISLRLP